MALEPLVRGDYEVIPFVIEEPDPANPGSFRLRDITQDTFTFTAKRNAKDALPLIQKTSDTGEGIVKTDAVNGEGEIEILPNDTMGITRETSLTCDIQGVAPVNKPYTTIFGLKIVLDISS